MVCVWHQTVFVTGHTFLLDFVTLRWLFPDVPAEDTRFLESSCDCQKPTCCVWTRNMWVAVVIVFKDCFEKATASGLIVYDITVVVQPLEPLWDLRISHACFGKTSHCAVIWVASAEIYGCQAPPGHTPAICSLNGVSGWLWPECETMTKANHLKTL